ncbi:ceramide glucosyltransferase [Trichonephila inaurata madagascariensis]|uniref:Ceramide glucosyltransferase n=1 Tax=Trichonephila inaurata madagascariensis TaxID=2747483 RepID=A0A8X7CCP1_9ARAC|nr:ceramide glucosyltransferase [Trichonephila inaurata madagascariensis]
MVLLFYTLYGFAIFFFGGWCFVWLLHIIAIINGKLKLHRKPQLPSPEVPLPGVSILKPLTGVDQNLYTNLESFFTMNYPKFELLFCIEDESDPSIMLVKKLIEKHPEIDASIFIGKHYCETLIVH